MLAAMTLHAADTPVPVLASRNGKTKTGRLRLYVRDDRALEDVITLYGIARFHPQRSSELLSGTPQSGASRAIRRFIEPKEFLLKRKPLISGAFIPTRRERSRMKIRLAT
jgi:hypothetical protein